MSSDDGWDDDSAAKVTQPLKSSSPSAFKQQEGPKKLPKELLKGLADKFAPSTNKIQGADQQDETSTQTLGFNKPSNKPSNEGR